MGPPGVRKVGLVISCGVVLVRCRKWGNGPCPRATQLSLLYPLNLLGPPQEPSTKVYQEPRQLTFLQGVSSAGNRIGRVRLVLDPVICGWCGRGTQHRDAGSCSFSALPSVTQPCSSSHDSRQLWATFPALEPRVSGCK